MSWDGVRDFLSVDRLSVLVGAAVRIVLILVVTWFVVTLLRRALPKFTERLNTHMTRRSGQASEETRKRAETLSGILLATLIVTAWTLAGLMILKEAGFDIGPVLAGAGVLGLAVGFGAQNLVRDVITGLMMLVENQVRVGDVAVVNGTGGAVERINLRTITLRSLDGVIHVFPNGTIETLSNMTHDFSYYVFETGVAYKEDTDKVIDVLRGVAAKLQEEEEYKAVIIEPLDVLGVDSFGDSAVVIKSRVKAKPGKQWMVGREMNRRIKYAFDEAGIEIPFPHQSIYFGEASRPFEVSLKERLLNEQVRQR